MKHFFAAILIVLLVSACATPPKPEEICTAKWIKPRVDAAMGDFRANADDIMSSLKKTGKKVVESEGNLGLLQRASVLLSLTRLVNTFQNGQTLKDLNTLSETCDDPELVMKAFTDVLQEYEVPESFISLLNSLQAFQELGRTL